MGVLKKMKKQWFRLNKNNIEVIKQEKERQELIKFCKEIGDIFNIKPYKQ